MDCRAEVLQMGVTRLHDLGCSLSERGQLLLQVVRDMAEECLLFSVARFHERLFFFDILFLLANSGLGLLVDDKRWRWCPPMLNIGLNSLPFRGARTELQYCRCSDLFI